MQARNHTHRHGMCTLPSCLDPDATVNVGSPRRSGPPFLLSTCRRAQSFSKPGWQGYCRSMLRRKPLLSAYCLTSSERENRDALMPNSLMLDTRVPLVCDSERRRMSVLVFSCPAQPHLFLVRGWVATHASVRAPRLVVLCLPAIVETHTTDPYKGPLPYVRPRLVNYITSARSVHLQLRSRDCPSRWANTGRVVSLMQVDEWCMLCEDCEQRPMLSTYALRS